MNHWAREWPWGMGGGVHLREGGLVDFVLFYTFSDTDRQGLEPGLHFRGWGGGSADTARPGLGTQCGEGLLGANGIMHRGYTLDRALAGSIRIWERMGDQGILADCASCYKR